MSPSEVPKRREEDQRARASASDVARLSQARVAVLGDIMIDHFIWGRVTRISPEAPVPVVDVDRSRENDGYRLGGAANVAHNIVSLGGRALLYGAVGDDHSSHQLWRLLELKGIDGRGVRQIPGRVTTLKTRVVAQNQQVVRFDVEDRTLLPESYMESIYESVLADSDEFDALIVSDYAKGLIGPKRLPRLITSLRAQGKVVAVDPKVKNLEAYQGASVITPNRAEACSSAGLSSEEPDAARLAGHLLSQRLAAEAVLVTLGEEGMLLCAREGWERFEAATAVEVFDVVGAGDTVIALFTMALAVAFDYAHAMRLANTAAGLVVGKIGTAIVTPSELEAALIRQPSR